LRGHSGLVELDGSHNTQEHTVSTQQPEQATSPDLATEVFQAIVINDDRASVLAALTEQAVAHFGHNGLRITNVRVTADTFSSTFFASANFSPRRF
jgi:hypothetical protein